MAVLTLDRTGELLHVDDTDCCIVGAGPAGAVLALLLARQGLRVTLLEAHRDFDRDFRGDTLNSAVLEIMARQREWPTRLIQGLQGFIQGRLAATTLRDGRPLWLPPSSGCGRSTGWWAGW